VFLDQLGNLILNVISGNVNATMFLFDKCAITIIKWALDGLNGIRGVV
jgi:hypothetical protein